MDVMANYIFIDFIFQLMLKFFYTFNERKFYMSIYKKFEDSLVSATEASLQKLLNEHNDIYIFSLSLSRENPSVVGIANTYNNLKELAMPGDEDYFYYKYCEEEWDLWEYDSFKDIITEELCSYTGTNNSTFATSGTYTSFFDSHCDEILESCKNALIRLKDFKEKNCPSLLFTVYIREYLSADECINIFKQINGKNAAEEYLVHIDDFV